jgi:hypothetical protein
MAYQDVVGNFMNLVSGSVFQPSDQSKFNKDELNEFDATFEHVVRGINRVKNQDIFTQKHYDIALYVAQLVKKKFGDLQFTGDGTGGFGMRAIIPEDVYGDANVGALPANDNDAQWELGNGAPQANWQIGARINKYLRNDHGWSIRNTQTMTGGVPAVCRDFNNDMWYTLYWGMMDEMASGLCSGMMVSLNNRPRAIKDFKYQMSNTESAYAELGYGVLYEPTVPFKTGLQFKPIDGAQGAVVQQIAAMRPIGVTFCTQRRGVIDNTQTTRPSQS